MAPAPVTVTREAVDAAVKTVPFDPSGFLIRARDLPAILAALGVLVVDSEPQEVPDE